MHIALEGMDGVGKTAQAKRLAERIGGEFIAKSFHEMNDVSGKYDNFITIGEYTNSEIKGNYGIRLNYLTAKIENNNIVTDRFYLSNYWSRSDFFEPSYYKRISMFFGEPDLIIILYARSEVLYSRISLRDSHDKDLSKVKMADKAYQLMFHAAKQMKLRVLVVDTSDIGFDDTNDILFCAYTEGIDRCVQEYKNSWLIDPQKRIIENDSGVFECYGDELVSCNNLTKVIRLPEEISTIREKAFSHCRGNIEIVISKNVTCISNYAFSMANIDSFSVDENSMYYAAADGMLYDQNFSTLLKVPSGMTQLRMKNVRELANNALCCCNHLLEFKLPRSVEKIGYFALASCKNLKTLDLSGGGIKYLGIGCFYGCNNLGYVNLVSKFYTVEDGLIKDQFGNVFFCIKEIRNDLYKLSDCGYVYPYAFLSRISADRLILNVKKVGSFAFLNCSFKELIMEDGIMNIGEGCFVNCNVCRIYVQILKVVPEIWKNSFEMSAMVILPNQKYCEIFSENPIWANYNLCYVICPKNTDVLCGSACVEYILQSYKGVSFDRGILRKDLMWVPELATTLSSSGEITTTLFCYDSKLMDDFKNRINCDGMPIRLLQLYYDNNGKIIEKRLSVDNIVAMMCEYKNLIFCVDSKTIFQDKTLEGNHFVILSAISDKFVDVISPGRQYYYSLRVSIERFMLSVESNGQWVIGVKNA